jgi:hypothetical protein
MRELSGAVVSGAVMAHPRRRAAAASLADTLGGLPVTMDRRPTGSNPLRTSILAWAEYGRSATHHVVLQDDVTVSGTALIDQAELAGTRFPGAVISFYANWDSFNGAAVRLAIAAGCDWVEGVGWDFFPTLATMLPTEVIDEYLQFAQDAALLRYADDLVLADFVRLKEMPAYMTAPSLAQHGDLESIVGNVGKRAACFTTGQAPRDVRRQHVASSLELCPFFWRGTPYCLKRVGPDGDRGWSYLHWSGVAADLGLSPLQVRALFDRRFHRALGALAFRPHEEKFAFALWVTAFLIAKVAAAGAMTVEDLDGRPAPLREPDPQSLEAALLTLGPGALADSTVSADFYTTHRPTLEEISRDGYAQGT